MSYYAAAIDCLEEVSPEVCRKILVQIAKTQPSAVIKAYNAVEDRTVNVLLISPGDSPIKVIKAIRTHTRLGLKEAKYIIDTAPTKVVGCVSIDAAKTIANDLTEVGAVVRISS